DIDFVLSCRADEWDVNKWVWEGILKVIGKGEECIIRLEDKTTGELYARAFLREGEPHPVESVIDSSRYFVLRVEENIGGRIRHAFIGIGFRERPEAYDFQAALHDHMKYASIFELSCFMIPICLYYCQFGGPDRLGWFVRYLDKKKTAEEMEQHFQHTSSVDYSLKEGETLVLQIKNKSGSGLKSKTLEQGVSNISLEEKGNMKEPLLSIKPPPPPPGPLSPASTAQSSPPNLPSNFKLDGDSKDKEASDPAKLRPENSGSLENQGTEDIPDDDFGDFQAAG
ncbi:NECAP, PHear domain, partial [Dillenia turbinata]